MLCTYSIEKLLGLQDVDVKNIDSDDKNITIHCRMKRRKHKCPFCGAETDTVHDYRKQIIKDIPAFGKNVFIVLSKRRYRCQCGKRFAEKVPLAVLHILCKHQKRCKIFVISGRVSRISAYTP